LDNAGCSAFYGGQGSDVIDNTVYRFIKLPNPNTVATPLTPIHVAINVDGSYFTGVPMNVQTRLGIYLPLNQWRGVFILHELGHQLKATTGFQPDAENQRLNEDQTRQIITRCFR